MIHDATARLRAPRPVLVLALLLLCAPLARAQTADLVRFQLWTADSLALAGSYFRAFDAAQPLVLLLHDRGASSYALAPLGYGLQDAGAAVFLPDLRGEGDSVNSRRGRVSPAPAWNASARALIARDLEAVLGFADRQPGLEGRPWVLIAEGEACALALEMLAEDAERAPQARRYAGGLLVSPLPTADLRASANAAPQPLLLTACDQDSVSLESVRALLAAGPEGSRRVELLPCRSRGLRALGGDLALPLRFLQWVDSGREPAPKAR